MRKLKDFKEMARELNTIRKANLGREMDRVEVCELISQVLPRDNGTIPTCVKLGILLRPKRGQYSFPTNPIHQKKLENFYTTLKKSVKKDEQIEQAIRLLEKNGFIITYDPLIRNGVRLSEALKVAKDYGYKLTKD